MKKKNPTIQSETTDKTRFRMNKGKKLRIAVRDALIILFVTLFLILIGLEIFLRYFSPLGYKFSSRYLKHAITCRPDPQLGWVNKTGTYTGYPTSSSKLPVTVTIIPDGSRATRPLEPEHDNCRGQIVLVGGSVMFGQGLSDKQTMAWKLQELIPTMDVVNFGVKGYSTYQSLLMMERVLPKTQKPGFVIYGFIDHHIDRNLAPEYWKATLNLLSSQNIAVPYVTLNKGLKLIRHTPESYSPWPFSKYALTIKCLEILIHRKAFLDGNNLEKYFIMQRLLLEMHDLCVAHDCELMVAMFIVRPELNELYSRFCRLNHIPVIDFDLNEIKGETFLIPGEGHPNRRVNSLWTKQTARFVLKRMAAEKAGETTIKP